MWIPFLFVFLAIAGSTSAENGWKAGTQYNYELRGRAVTGFLKGADQYSGLAIRAKVLIHAKSDSDLSIQVHGAEYAEVHANLSSGWASPIPEDHLDYTSLQISTDPFEVKFENGVVKGLVIDKSLPVWEVNMLKSIASLLQVDTNGGNLDQSRSNLLPNEANNFGTYKTMEDSIHGVYETEYDVSELPELVLERRPEMVPLPNLRGTGNIINIVKTTNFSNSKQHMVFHHGMGGIGKGEPGSNSMGNFFSRSSVSRIILTGTMKRYAIQSSVTDDKIVIAPHLYNSQKGIVATRLNLTLEGVGTAQGPSPVLHNPREISDLVFQYDNEPKEAWLSKKKSNEHSYGDSSEEAPRLLPSIHRKSSKLNEMTNQKSIKDSDEYQNDEFSDSSSSSSSSSDSSESLDREDFYQTMSELSQPSRAPYLIFYTGYQGQPIHQAKDFNPVQKAIKISREIGYELANPNTITGSSTLSKFITLARLVRTTSADQQKQIGDKLYTSQSKLEKTSEGPKDYQAWVAYRDAVAQAGTGPALLTIKSWLNSSRVKGEEAAQLLAVLPNSVRMPTSAYMQAFFEIVKDSKIEAQTFVNTSAILSFADLVRKSMVDSKSMHHYFPVHAFGPTNRNASALEAYIEYFDGKLHEAMKEGDSIKIQTYITALGNMAHYKILSSYEPYLEGQKPSSAYQRLLMIASFNKMTKVYTKQARSVLFRVYQNEAESPEIRTAAVMQLMKTNPPAQMLQRMAEKTNFEHSKQVRAAVKSAIESAARQPPNKFNKLLIESAQSAVNLLTPESFGLHNSKNYIRSFAVKEHNMAYKHHLSYIQSRDSILPKSVFYTLKRNLGDYKRDSHEMRFMASSIGQLIDQLFERIDQPSSSGQKNSRNDSKWSTDKIYEALKFEKPNQDQLEGNILFTAFGGERHFYFDNRTIGLIPKLKQEIRSFMQNGKNFNYTKYYNQYSYELAFSTGMGLPFVYSLDVPTVLSLNGNAKSSLRNQQMKERKSNLSSLQDFLVDGAVDITHSTKVQGYLGFVAPFNNKAYSAGLEKNIEFRFPLNVSTEFDLRNKTLNITVQLLSQGEQQKVFEYSSDAYTTSYSTVDLQPMLQMKNTMKIYGGESQERNVTYGQYVTGTAFDVSIKGVGRHLDLAKLYSEIRHHDPVSAFLYGAMDENIDSSNITVSYNPAKSFADRMRFSFQFKNGTKMDSGRATPLNKHKRSGPGKTENLAVPSSGEKDNELLRNVLAGIENGEGYLAGMSVTFEGKQKREYELVVVHGRSPASEESRILTYLRNSSSQGSEPFEAGLQLDFSFPKVPLVNFKDAMNADPTSKISGKLDFGKEKSLESSVTFEGILKRSPERREHLQKHPTSAHCEKQMQNGYQASPACRNATARANYLDSYRFTVSYNNIPQKLQNYSYLAYRVAHHLGYPYNEEKIFDVNNKEGQFEMKLNFSSGLRRMNASLEAPSFSSKFEDVHIHEWVRPAIVMHPTYNMIERLGRRILLGQQFPVCSLDGNQITTFDNKSFKVNLGNNFHVLAMSLFDDTRGHDNFGVFAQQLSGNLMEVVIAMSSRNLLQIRPESEKLAKIFFNGREVAVQEDQSGVILTDESGREVFRIIYVPNGSYRVMSKDLGLELIWSGRSLILQVENSFRGKVKGLCGNLDGEVYNDWITPQGLIVNSTDAFAKSYAFSLGTSGENPQAASRSQSIGVREEVILGDVISEEDKGMKSGNKSNQASSIKAESKKKSADLTEIITDYRLKVIQEPGKTCFSLKALKHCGSNAKASRFIEKTVDFHCMNKSTASRHLEKMVELGATPDLTRKGVNHRAILKVPEHCDMK